MSEFIDPIVIDAVEGRPLPAGHHAREFAAGLPAWHPVRRLLTGESQWTGRLDAVYVFFRLFCDVYADFIWPPPKGAAGNAVETFLRVFPDDVAFRGDRYRLHKLYRDSRKAVETAAAGLPPVKTIALYDFDRAFSDLVRSVMST